MVRQLKGVESTFGYQKHQFSYQNIIDNVSLLDDEMVKKINAIIVEFGHEVFKKKEAAALHLKTDSFVVESNVHFPTDYNLLWDSARKALDMVTKVQDEYNLPGWRKVKNWRGDLKNKMRALGRASASGGKGKQERVKKTTRAYYLTKAKTLYNKIEKPKKDFPREGVADMIIMIEMQRFMDLLQKHIDLLDRRILKGEKIPHSEKMFSIFEQYTEWVTKGKMRPNVELGKKVSITTDQYHLIVDYRVMDHESDSTIVPGLKERLGKKYTIKNWSFDKGFWSRENKELLSEVTQTLVLPKKGKCNKKEAEEEHRNIFKKSRNKNRI